MQAFKTIPWGKRPCFLSKKMLWNKIDVHNTTTKSIRKFVVDKRFIGTCNAVCVVLVNN
jgi:hypothetical protein